ncbi:testis-expressed protein 49 [Bombina bombina]|uniref:testis-expressed protein 49 n=1 Tax=Bombina bombina TaxID=8345 RepID=UPI00235AEE91|nr:testis-expressed protein 49 [Bombina bombina]
MAFFGLTALGYQDPFRAARLVVPEVQKNDTGGIAGNCEEGESNHVNVTEVAPPSTYISQSVYKERVNRNQTLRTPKETQRKPMTATQHYGWWLPQDPNVKADNVHPWIKGPHHPMISSPMTRFVDQMALTNKDFSLF